MSWLFTSGGQSIGASASASVLPMNIQGGPPLGLTGLISLPSKGLTRVFQAISLPICLWVLFLPFEVPDPHSFLLSSGEDMSLNCLDVLESQTFMGLPYEAN